MTLRSSPLAELARSTTRRSKLAVALVFGAGAFVLLLQTPWIPGGDDGWRHVKFAHRLATEGRQALADPWHLLYFWPAPIDGWFGYHVLLAPFTVVFGMITGAKVLTSLVCAGIAYALLELLDEAGVEWKLAWVTVATFASGLVLYRAMFARPFLLSILLVLLATLATLRRNAWGVFVVSALHAFAYSIVFLVGLPVFLSVLLRRDRRSLVLAVACGAGLVLGSVVHPYFPENLHFYAVQAFAPLSIGRAQDLKIGGELEPLSLGWILVSLPAVVLFATAAARWLWLRRSVDSGTAPTLLFAIAALTLLVSLRVGRMFDYFVPFAVVFSAAILTRWLAASGIAAKFVVLTVGFFCAANGVYAWRQVAAAPTPMKFSGVSEYLLEQPQPGTVFNTHWGYYNQLYYLNSRDRYLIGIDPTFMYLMDRGRYWLWRHISDDESTTCDRPECGSAPSRPIAAAIAEDLRASYVVVERAVNPNLSAYLASAPEFEEVYRDEATSLYALAR